MFNGMKTATTREFYHTPALVRSLRAGQSLIVTDKGAPSFVVTKAGKRPRKTAADIERENRQLFPHDRPKVNTLEIIRKLRQ
jgi:antitoxin (DNA-binding transcriptional repressor) of toxin-antitoxin stability system